MSNEPSGRQNGAAIRAFRKKEGLTVAELAMFVGLHPQALTNIENGSKPASMEVIRHLHRVLGVPIEAITRDGTDRGIEAGPTEANGKAVAA
jgi:transcriptional regulator with XRE-family HTH domain